MVYIIKIPVFPNNPISLCQYLYMYDHSKYQSSGDMKTVEKT